MLNTGCSPVFASFLVVQYLSGYSCSYLMRSRYLFSVLWSRQKKPPLPLADGLKSIAVSSERRLNCRHKNALTLRDSPILYPSPVFFVGHLGHMLKNGLKALLLNIFCCPTWSGTHAFLVGTRGTLCPMIGRSIPIVGTADKL